MCEMVPHLPRRGELEAADAYSAASIAFSARLPFLPCPLSQLFPPAALPHTGYGSTRCLPRLSAEMPMLSVSQSCMGMTDSATSTPKYLDE